MTIWFIPLISLWLIFTGKAMLISNWFRVLGVVFLAEFFLRVYHASWILELIGIIVAAVVLIIASVDAALSRMGKRQKRQNP